MPTKTPFLSTQVDELTKLLRRVSEAKTPQESSFLFGAMTRIDDQTIVALKVIERNDQDG